MSEKEVKKCKECGFDFHRLRCTGCGTPIEEEINDEYHTMDELYEHRHMLFIALCIETKSSVWRAKIHEDGTEYEGYFIAGIELPCGEISYHIPNKYWWLLDYPDVKTSLHAPKWDGYTPLDVIKRIKMFLKERGNGE